jgi:Fe2+ or Zn2+ uptake regulation protein
MDQAQLPRLTEQLRDRGLKATGPRLAVLQLLERQPHHLSVDDVYRQVQAERPHVSVATIYRVLEDLAEHDIVGTLRLGGDRVHYELRSDRHNHAICKDCGHIQDIETVQDCGTACLPDRSAGGFSCDVAEVVFVGLCGSCRNARDERHGSAGEEGRSTGEEEV